MRAIIFDYFGVLAHRYGECDEELMEFIGQNLAGKYKLAVLSNMSGGSEAGMFGGYVRLFDEVVLSGDIGVSKPDERAYSVAAQRLEEFISDCLMIDDSETNCAGAEQAGMSAIWFQNKAELRRELEKYGILTS